MKIFKFLALAAMSLGIAACGSKPAPTPTPVENKFPVKEVIAFYDEAGLDVVVPSYVSKTNDFETDTSDPAAFVIYANSSTQEEMVAYKDALVVDSWVVTSEADGDYSLKYAETDAIVSLVNFEEYIGIAFSVYKEAEAYTPETGIKHIAEHISQFFQSPITAQQDEESGEWFIGINLGTSMTVETLKGYVTNLFIPADFIVSGDWKVGQFSDGTEVNYLLAVCAPIYAEYDVYVIENVGTILQIQCFDIPQE